jgi:hypothetical protein
MLNRRDGSQVAVCLLTATVLAAGLGCGKEVTLRETVLEAAALEQTLSADHAELRTELARIDTERGLPLQIARPLPPAEKNAAAALEDVIDPLLRSGILERSKELFPEAEFQFTPLALAEVRQFLGKHRRRLDRVYKALERPQCVFPIEYRLGFFYEPSFVDDVTVACRLLAFDAAVILATGEVTAALRPVDAMWRLAGCMGREPLLTARLRSAELRAEALLVSEAIANHPHCRHADVNVLSEIVERELAGWPSDAVALSGDRAMTLHAYECLRRGLLKWILTAEEKRRFREQLNLDSLPEVLAETIDADEAFCLATMRRHIELCDLPYHRRKSELTALVEEIDARRRSADRASYPLLAAMLFLPDLKDAHEAMARDRARCEAFALALAHAAGGEPPAFETSPHHGLPYEVVRESLRVVVKLNEPDERDVVIAMPGD